jgi:hypothetical protein
VNLNRPVGVGIGVVFDWALAAQLTTQGVAGVVGRLGETGGVTGLIWRLVAAGVLIAAGEALRRGVPWMRIAQIVLTALVTVGGIASVVLLLAGHGGRGLVLSAIVEVTFAPYITWGLTRPQTAEWFAAVRGKGRAPRLHGTGWIAVLATWSAVWGVLVAWSQSL